MDTNKLDSQLSEINKKLDLLTEQAAITARRQREFEELKDDLQRIGTDIFQSAVVELNEVANHFDANDLLHLIKKVLRNVRNLSKMFDQLESVNDFIRDFAPSGKVAFLELLSTFDEMDRKGYFEFIKESTKVIDKVVTSFNVDDIRLLGDNIVSIMNTIKNLTQPDMLAAMNNAVSIYKNLDFVIDDKVSYFKLFKEAKTPEMRRGIAYGIQFLKSLSKNAHQLNNNGTNAGKI